MAGRHENRWQKMSRAETPQPQAKKDEQEVYRTYNDLDLNIYYSFLQGHKQ